LEGDYKPRIRGESQDNFKQTQPHTHLSLPSFASPWPPSSCCPIFQLPVSHQPTTHRHPLPSLSHGSPLPYPSTTAALSFKHPGEVTVTSTHGILFESY